MEMGRFTEAEKSFNRALDIGLGDKQADALVGMAILSLRKGDRAAAKRRYLAAAWHDQVFKEGLEALAERGFSFNARQQKDVLALMRLCGLAK
ncbi:MAG: hypothetical protein HY922_06555 [Elusimicrobia bacterium]|nr:hypothetical protein [Elusimicrobiota bacterium]